MLENDAPTALPRVFASPVEAPDFTTSVPVSRLRQRILESDCAYASADLSRLGMESGMSTRGAGKGGLYLEHGKTTAQVEWFLVRGQDAPEQTYCGLALFESEGETRVTVANVRRSDMQVAKAAVESGDFLCTCKALSR